jgi:hypothetical protein
MRFRYFCCFLLLGALGLFVGSAWAQAGSPVVYVSGSGGLIFSVNTMTGATLTLVSNPSAAYEGLVVGPDNAAADNPSHPFLLYACDPAHNTIIRFDPNNAPFQGGPAAEIVYAGGLLQQPQCGRFTNTGDLIVTSKVAGSGIWKFAGVANIALGAGGFPAPVQNSAIAGFSLTQVDQGIAQTNIGDLLIVDTANKDVLLSQYGTIPAFSVAPTVFIASSSLLPAPFGIAKNGAGNKFVSNQGKGTNSNSIMQFDAQGANGSQCVSFGHNVTPFFMQMSADNTLYVATQTSSSGAVFSVNTATCSAKQLSSSIKLPQLVGIALPPTTVSQTALNFSGTQTFNFGFAAFQFTSPSCSLSVTADEENQAEINALIADDPTDFPKGGTPGVDLGRDGFETAFNLTIPTGDSCTPEFSDGTFSELAAVEVDNLLVSNPRVLACDGTSCTEVELFGIYTLGGLLPQDSNYTGKGSTSQHFVINENLTSGSELGTFCGLESPFTDVSPPNIAGTFVTGNTISVKFKLAQASGNCQNGPWITDAVALLSVAQILDSNANPVFNPININSSGSSTPVPPIFKFNGTKHQYEFSLSLQGYALGTYSLTVTFLTSNTVQQTVEFQVVQ